MIEIATSFHRHMQGLAALSSARMRAPAF